MKSLICTGATFIINLSSILFSLHSKLSHSSSFIANLNLIYIKKKITHSFILLSIMIFLNHISSLHFINFINVSHTFFQTVVLL